jgi:iron-sulfur cluster assembly 2
MPASGYCANGKVDSAWRPTRSHFFQGQLLYRVVKNGEQECYFSTAADLPNNSSSIIFTTACCERIKFLKQEKQNCHLHLRISVESGGCSGFQYNFSIEENSQPDSENDYVVEQEGVTVVYDRISGEFLRGATVDFVEEMIRSSFVVHNNPNVEVGCGCGVSFSPKVGR